MSLVLDDVCCENGRAFCLDNICMDLKGGDLGCLFGKTGCGKSTLLKLVAGFNKVKSGKIFVGGKLLSGEGCFVLPELRNIGIVFQHPSLFPHKTVFENVSFGIRSQRNYKKKVLCILERLNLVDFRNKFPKELSGGEQQLVTIARSVVCDPVLLLLDEPFSNMDMGLRKKMLKEIVSFLKEGEITTLFVTHDPEEALDFSDKIFCLRGGEIVQNGSPKEVYYNPNDTNLAGFFGMINCINGSVSSNCLDCPLGKIYDERIRNKKTSVCVRPEAIVLADEGVMAVVQDVKFYNQMILIKIGECLYWMRFSVSGLPSIGDKIRVKLDLNQVMFLNAYKKEGV